MPAPGLLAARVLGEPSETARAAASTSSYPETRIGPFGLFTETHTEPLAFVSTSTHRACGDPWLELTKDLGFFGQEDPAGTIDSTNRYQALRGRWTGVVDPSGMYGIDFHYYAVYVLSRAIGLSHSESETIAWASHSVDTFAFSKPNSFINGAIRTSRNQVFHFIAKGNQPTERNSPLAVNRVLASIENREPARFGMALHMFADTYSHEGYSAGYTTRNVSTGEWGELARTISGALSLGSDVQLDPVLPGHAGADEYGFKIDRPYRAVDKAMEASRRILEFLELFIGPRPIRPEPLLSRTALEAILQEGFSFEHPDEAVRAARWEALVERVFHQRISYLKGEGSLTEKYFNRILEEEYAQVWPMLK